LVPLRRVAVAAASGGKAVDVVARIHHDLGLFGAENPV
jgi:hypothetical protein